MRHYKTITEHRVRALKPSARRVTITEDGLAVEVHPSGKKSFYARYRQNGKLYKELLGYYSPEPRLAQELSVKDARAKVLSLQNAKAQGALVSQSAATFREFVEGPFRDWCLSQRKDGQATMDRLRAQFLYATLLADRIERLQAEPESPRRNHLLAEARKQRVGAADAHIADKRLREITTEQIESIKSEQVRAYKPRTAKRNLSDLRRVFNKAVEWDYLRKSPATRVSDPKVDRNSTKLYLSPAELQRLEAALDAWEADRNTYNDRKAHPEYLPTLVRLAINTGMRPGELTKLRWRDINPDTKEVTVRGEQAKDAETRRIPLNDKLLRRLAWWKGRSGRTLHGTKAKTPLLRIGATDAELLAEALDESLAWDTTDESKNDPVFPVTHTRKAWDRLMLEAKLDITPHHLRHHFASSLVLKGTALHVVQELLGHSSIETTSIYLSVRTEDKFEAVNLL